MTDTKDNTITNDENMETDASSKASIIEEEHVHDEEETEFEFIEPPSFEIDYKGDCAYEVKVVIPPVNEEKHANDLFDELKHEAIVPGFRKGRAPIKLIQKKFEKYVKNEVEAKLIAEAFRKLVKDNQLRPISQPNIEGHEKERAPGEPLAVTLKFEVAPRVELGKYRGIELTRKVARISDKHIENAVDALRNRYAVYEPLKDEVAAEGDQVIIDFTGTVDGQEFRGGSAKNYPYILGTKRFFPEFESVLLGASVGEEKTCSVQLPNDFFNEELRGKTAEFKITIKEIRRKKTPALDDEFAKLAGYANVDELKTKTKERLEDQARKASEANLQAEALEKVIEASTFELPKSMIEETAERYYQTEVQRLLSSRVPMSRIEEMESELRENARNRAIRDIKSVVVLHEIADAEGLTVSDEDLEKDLESYSERSGVELEALIKYLDEDQERRSSFETRILENKALAVIIDNATIKEEIIEEKADVS